MADNFFSGLGPPPKTAVSPPASETQSSAAFFSDIGMNVGLRAKDFATRREPGIDYFSGVPLLGLRAGLSRMDNEEEQKGYLETQVGEGNVRKDKFGAWIIEPAGLLKIGIRSDRPVAIDEQRATLSDVADLAGSAPAFFGGAGAAVAANGM